MRNRILLEGILDTVLTLRQTPAGIPIVEGELLHESEQHEAGLTRKVKCVVKIVVIGKPAEQFCRIPVHSTVRCKGFLAALNHRQPDRLVMHIDEYEFSESRKDHVPT
ncbi:primosomal replication protein N [Chitinilyticum piscinae]|uniref:Replication restart protein PriB n=1 Tax=Chitinilyticum piscinae TaxID=2866724 RepID=A0A8J7FKF5_9NEIS|nr:primosomal replication protein N [Chitinilyticum piscinae]MBE9609632.1 primosomal replication protein N [Chitinilyticum piscinae]